jgi:hypothetical protein
MRIGESHTLHSEFVDVGRSNLAILVVDFHITITKVISEDVNDIGLGSVLCKN